MGEVKKIKDYVPTKSDKYILLLGLILLPIFVYMIYDLVQGRKQYNRLKTEGIVDTAMIVRPSVPSVKGSNSCEYIFNVGGKTFEGHTSLGADNKVKKGELYLVRYLPGDTNINLLIKDERYRFLRVTSPSWVKRPEVEKIKE